MIINKNKVKDILVILLFAFSIIFFVYCSIFVKEVKLYSEDVKNEVTESESHELENLEVSNEIFVDNMNFVFEKYTGELTRLNVSKSIRDICLNKLYNLKNISISKTYFKNNYNEIVITYGITNYDDFAVLHSNIQGYEKNVKSISIVENTVYIGESNSSFKVKVTFESDNYIILKFVINNTVSTNISEVPNITVLAQE